MTGERGVVRARTKRMNEARRAGGARPRQRGIVAIIVGMVLAIAGLLGSTAPAMAAPSVTYPGAIGSVSLENENGGGPLVQW